MKYCNNCGQENLDDAKYCSKCGNKLDQVEEKNITLKKKKISLSKGTKIILVCLVLLLGIGGGYGAYIIYNNYKFDEAMNAGNDYLNQNKYKEALSKYQEALTIKDNESEVYLKEATAALHIRDNDIAKEAYSKLYDITQNSDYKNLVNFVDYGNNPNNLTNGGNVAFQGEFSYFIDNKSGEADIWKVTPQKMELLKTIPFRQGDQPLKSLNAWGNQLFFIIGDNIATLDIDRKEFDVIPISYVNNICVYKGVIYYTTSITPNAVTPGVYKCNLDGSNQETIYYGTNIFSNWNFIINNDYLYLNQTALNVTESHLIKISLNDYSSSEIYTHSNGIISQMILKDNLCYFNSVKTSDSDMTVSFTTEISSINLDDNSINTIQMNVPISTLNIINDKIYYISENKVYFSEMGGQNAIEVGTTLSSHTTSDSFGLEVYSIDTSLLDTYVITGLSYQVFQPIGNNQKFTEIVNTNDDYSLTELEFREGEIEKDKD